MPQGIQVEVYRDTAPHTLVEVLNARMEPSALQELKNHGVGSFMISKRDKKILADPTLIDYRTLIRIRADGLVTSAFPIQTKKSVTVGEGESADEVWTISGEGVRTWFNDAKVQPAGGLKKFSKETRYFNFASPRGSWYDEDQWTAPVNIWKYNEAGSFWGTAPADWPDSPNSYWVGPFGRSTYEMPKGTVYYRQEWTASVTGQYSFFFSVDDWAEVYIDGELVFTSAEHQHYETARVDFEVAETGDHVIGLKTVNSSVTGGPTGIISALYQVGDPLVPSSAVLVKASSSSTWLMQAYPGQEPGWTVGDVLITLLNEAEARGIRFPTNLNLTFTESVDSAGNAWDPAPWSFAVGTTSYSDVLAVMEELACDVYLDPDTLNLYAWKQRGVDRSLTSEDDSVIPVVLRPAQNLTQADATGQADITNSLLLRTSDGWSLKEPDDDSSQTKYGVLEGQVSTELSDLGAALLVDELFRQKAKPEISTTIEIVPVPGAIPFVDFNVGDYVSAPSEETGQLLKRRVMSISTTESDAGQVRYAVEFDTIFRDRTSVLEQALSRGTGTSSLGAGFVNGSGTPSTVVQGQIPSRPLAGRPDTPTGLSVTSTPRWTDLGEPTSDFSLVWNPVTSSGAGAVAITDVTSYEVWGRPTATSEPQLLATVTEPEVDLLGYTPNVEWVFQVLANSRTGGQSLLSDPVTETSAVPLEPLEQPSQPSLVSDLGVVVVSWDGLLGGEPAPAHFKSMRVERSTALEGTYTSVTTFERVAGQDGSGVVGTTYYYRLVAIDRLGGESAPSLPAQITVQGVQAGQISVGAVVADNIAANAVNTIHIAQGAVTREKVQSGAIGTNEIADFALTAKKFNTGRHLIF